MTLNDIIPFIREFGPLNGVLFILLLALLGIVWKMIFDHGKLLEEIKETLSVHHASQLTLIESCNGTREDVDTVGKNVDKLVTVLTIKRRMEGNDGNGKTGPDSKG